MLEIDAAASRPAPAAKRRRAKKPAQASAQAIEGLQGITAIVLDIASQYVAQLTDIPQVEFRPGQTEKDLSEAEILAYLPAEWLARTSFGREVGAYLISDEHKAIALTLIAYLARIAPPAITKIRSANVSHRRNSPPPRREASQPASAGAGAIVSDPRYGPAISDRPVTGASHAGAAANGAYPGSQSDSISVPRF